MNVLALTEQILQKMSRIGKVKSNFFLNLVDLWTRLRGRYCFENFVRQGFLNAMSYRKHFSLAFDFKQFNRILIEDNSGTERLIFFDPSFISKSGKHTHGVGRFWSGCAQSVKNGLEIAALAIGDIENHTAFHYHCTQTVLKENQSLMEFYIAYIQECASELRQLSKHIVVDAFFAQHAFFEPISKQNLYIITRLRDNAALWYIHQGQKTGTRGRPTKYDGKVLVKELNMNHFKEIQTQDASKYKAFEAVLFSKSLKANLKVVIVHNLKKDGSIKNHVTFASTDTTLNGNKLWQYYQLRFQQEFLFRDGKQHLGLTECQSRQKERLDFHHNFSLTVISLMKVAHWLSIEKDKRPSFSVQDIKTQYFNEHIFDKLISGLGISPETVKKLPIYQNLINYTKIAA